jgi:hypothetical protein
MQKENGNIRQTYRDWSSTAGPSNLRDVIPSPGTKRPQTETGIGDVVDVAAFVTANVNKVSASIDALEGIGKDEGVTLPTRDAKDFCSELVVHLTLYHFVNPHVDNSSLRMDVGLGELGGLTLIVDSTVTDKRLTFRIAAQGSGASVSKISGENVDGREFVEIGDAVKPLHAWLIKE